MLIVETIARIRREYFLQGKTIREIARALTLRHPLHADCDRYDTLRRTV